MWNNLGDGDMARSRGDSGQAAVLDAGQIKRLLKIAQTTMHGERDQTVITLSYWLGLRAKELAGLCIFI
jgi:integrase/recombinase XerD